MHESDTLSEDIQEALEEICTQGNEAMDEGDPDEALLFFTQALNLLPDPAEEWMPYGWLMAAMGDAHYALGNYAEARAHLSKAEEFAGPEEVNPFVLLRLGQCCRQLGEADKALDCLHRAWRLDGDCLFDEHPDDLRFLKDGTGSDPAGKA